MFQRTFFGLGILVAAADRHLILPVNGDVVVSSYHRRK
jgi:hypothetical protein